MPSNSRTLAFTSGFAIAVVAMSSAVSADGAFSDAEQETQVWRAYAQSQYLRANNLEVTVLNGKATLTGKVEGQLNKDLARLIALGVEGVVEVDNQIVVRSQTPLPKPPDSADTPAYFAERARRGGWDGNLNQSAFPPSYKALDSRPPGHRVNSGWLSGGADNPEQRAPVLGRVQTRDEANSVNREGFKF